jgi:predicted ATPase
MILSGFGLRNEPEEKEFPFSLPLIQNLPWITFKAPVTFLVGENGAGKSTLLEALAYASAVPAVGGTSLDEDPLMEPARRLGKLLSLRFLEKSRSGFFVRAEDFLGFVKSILRNVAELDAEMEEIKATWPGGDLDRALATLRAEKRAYTEKYTENFDGMSHGEGFLRFFQQRITGKGLYIIDEPEAALSPARQLSLLLLILDAVKQQKAQFIIATHSPIIMALPIAEILLLEEGEIKSVSYRETPHYQLTHSFLQDPLSYFRALENS